MPIYNQDGNPFYRELKNILSPGNIQNFYYDGGYFNIGAITDKELFYEFEKLEQIVIIIGQHTFKETIKIINNNNLSYYEEKIREWFLSGKLIIKVLKDRSSHVKVYIFRNTQGKLVILKGSANLSKTGIGLSGNQEEDMDLVLDESAKETLYRNHLIYESEAVDIKSAIEEKILCRSCGANIKNKRYCQNCGTLPQDGKEYSTANYSDVGSYKNRPAVFNRKNLSFMEIFLLPASILLLALYTKFNKFGAFVSLVIFIIFLILNSVYLANIILLKRFKYYTEYLYAELSLILITYALLRLNPPESRREFTITIFLFILVILSSLYLLIKRFKGLWSGGINTKLPRFLKITATCLFIFTIYKTFVYFNGDNRQTSVIPKVEVTHKTVVNKTFRQDAKDIHWKQVTHKTVINETTKNVKKNTELKTTPNAVYSHNNTVYEFTEYFKKLSPTISLVSSPQGWDIPRGLNALIISRLIAFSKYDNKNALEILNSDFDVIIPYNWNQRIKIISEIKGRDEKYINISYLKIASTGKYQITFQVKIPPYFPQGRYRFSYIINNLDYSRYSYFESVKSSV